MGRKKTILFPQVEFKLKELGYRIKMARLRRRIPVELVARRAKVSRTSVWEVENGSPSVSMGIYAAVLMAIGMMGELDNIIKEDILGKTLQDLNIKTGKRVRKK